MNRYLTALHYAADIAKLTKMERSELLLMMWSSGVPDIYSDSGMFLDYAHPIDQELNDWISVLQKTIRQIKSQRPRQDMEINPLEWVGAV